MQVYNATDLGNYRTDVCGFKIERQDKIFFIKWHNVHFSHRQHWDIMSQAHVMKDGFYKVSNGLQPVTKVKDHVMYSKDYRFDTEMTIDIEYGKVNLYRIKNIGVAT